MTQTERERRAESPQTDGASPVFIRGYSRSGGTLLVTVLDAHPILAMSYELYPRLLTTVDKQPADVAWLLEVVSANRKLRNAADATGDRNLRTFLLRCIRSGLDNNNLKCLLQEHIDEGDDFKSVKGRLRFIERCCLAKMHAKNKSRWGLKCNTRFNDYLDLWPGACFLNMVRDGRDVLASQLNTGAFSKKKTVERISKGWAKTHMKFRRLLGREDVRAHEVFYESLVKNPETEIRKICEFLGIEFHNNMLDFYKKDLTIYKARHLSMDRISKPIDTSKIGRWKNELNESHLQQFYSSARDVMIAMGYMPEQ